MPTTLLPFIANATTVPYGTGVGGTGGPSGDVALLYDLMRSDVAQRRSVCVWDERIAAVAQARCDQQLHDGAIFVRHLDKQGKGPNWWLRRAGIWLPPWYSQDAAGNNVESIGLNYLTAALCWQAWLSSPAHRTHCLGEGMFDEQTQVGIGFSKGPEPYPIFWSLISCVPME